MAATIDGCPVANPGLHDVRQSLPIAAARADGLLASPDFSIARDVYGAQFGQSAQQVIDKCGMLAERGVTDTWVNPPPLDDFNAYLDHMAWVAEEVIPKVG